jgi:hypothetical protein
MLEITHVGPAFGTRLMTQFNVVAADGRGGGPL